MYTYTFIKNSSLKTLEVKAVNVWEAAKKLNIQITRMDKLSPSYLQSTPFNERERFAFAVGGSYTIQQSNL